MLCFCMSLFHCNVASFSENNRSSEVNLLRDNYKLQDMNEKQRDLLLKESDRFPPPKGCFPHFHLLLQQLLLFIASNYWFCVYFVVRSEVILWNGRF